MNPHPALLETGNSNEKDRSVISDTPAWSKWFYSITGSGSAESALNGIPRRHARKGGAAARGAARQQVRIGAVEEAAGRIAADIQALDGCAVLANGVHVLVDADAIH